MNEIGNDYLYFVFLIFICDKMKKYFFCFGMGILVWLYVLLKCELWFNFELFWYVKKVWLGIRVY